jgi:hypothetical protein
MIKRILLAAIIVGTLATSVAAQGNGFGLGLMIGEPTGIAFKQWLGQNTALDAGLAWSLDDDAKMHIHADYLIHRPGAIKGEGFSIAAYYGIGGRIKLRNDNNKNNHDDWIGVRIPFGLNYQMKSAPIDFFFEIVPIMDLAPDTDFDLNAALGVRYFFGGSSRSSGR